MAASAEPSVSRQLADAMHGLPFEALPGEVIEHARWLAVDTRMVALAGAAQPDVEAVAALIRRNGGVAQSPLWRCGTRVPAAEAAFVNALAASALDYDSLHENVHPDAIVLAAASAVAAAVHADGRELARAYVLGSELVCRLANAATGPQKGWTLGAVLGTFGAAMAASLLLKLAPQRATHALGLCLSMAAGSQQTNVEQVLAKRLQPALAARHGVQAAQLASVGITAPAQAFEGRFGLWTLYFEGDRHRLLDGLGDRFALLRTGLKRYPVCACSHAAMEALHEALRDGRIGPDEIEAIEVAISPFVARLVGGPFQPEANPQVTAQFSLQYALASIALRGRLAVAELATEAVQDARIADLVRRIVVIVDASNPNELAPATVRVVARGGRDVVRTVAHMPGGPEAPLTAAAARAKWLECAAAAGAGRPEDMLEGVEREWSARALAVAGEAGTRG
mgnify:CR=1 FL=1